MARGRDAADVAISAFGAAPLARFEVITDEVKAETARASQAA
jgi:hypothetical protein